MGLSPVREPSDSASLFSVVVMVDFFFFFKKRILSSGSALQGHFQSSAGHCA